MRSTAPGSGTLYVVSTPIGNLEDMTLRAIRVLREVDLIAAEDTRHTAKLLRHFEIKTPTTSFHAHSPPSKLRHLLDRLARGSAVALVSDAGTPGISDPGVELVRATQELNARVEVIPGASAVLSALIASGFSTASFTFLGFPPSRSKNRKLWLRTHIFRSEALVVFESPHRIRRTLDDMLDVWGDRTMALIRELTKRHEECIKGPISQISSSLTAVRGELTLVFAPVERPLDDPADQGDDESRDELGATTETTVLSRRMAVARLAQQLDLPVNEVYRLVEGAKKRSR